MWSNMSHQGEFQGLINIKIPSRIKSRSFIPWKAWKRQWIVIRRSRSARSGVELVIGRNSSCVVQVSVEDTICRTESRSQYYAFGIFPQNNKRRASVYLSGTSETDSQKWISTIRRLLKPPLLPVEENEFSVSLIDNFFSKSAGLSGLYGTLRISEKGITIVDPFTSKNKIDWPWTSMSEFQMSSTISKEDKGHIFTIITSREFIGGVGAIHMFCEKSLLLVKKLTSKSNPFFLPTRHHTFSQGGHSSFFSSSYSTLGNSFIIPKPFNLSKRLSRSEGNLLSAIDHLEDMVYNFVESPSMAKDDEISVDSFDYFKKRKVAPGIISAGLGVFLSTPGGSEADCDSLHDYQRLQQQIGDSDDDWLSFNSLSYKFSPPRRVSGESMASGVYEEIKDFSNKPNVFNSDDETQNDYELSPPPLPPRRDKLLSKSLKNNENDGYIDMLQVPRLINHFLSKSAGNTPVSSPLSLSKYQMTEETEFPKVSSWDSTNDCNYLPMSPSCALSTNISKTNFVSKEAIEEQHYVIMSGIKTT